MTSIFAQVLAATRDVIVGLDLADVPTERIILLSAPPRPTDQVMTTLPAIVIAPLGPESIVPATNLQDDYTFPIAVAIVDATQNQATAFEGLDARLVWREAIMRAFNQKRMTAVTGITTQNVQPMEAVNAGWWGQGYFVSAMVVRVTVRKVRAA